MHPKSRTQNNKNISCSYLLYFQIEIIPWLLKNNYYSKGDATRTNVDSDRTVFVDGIPGNLTADELAHAFEDGFGSVEIVYFETDSSFYPTGKLWRYTMSYS